MKTYNHRKAAQLINYFAAYNNGSINKMKAFKLIWLVNRLHLKRYARTVTGDIHYAMEWGAVPRNRLHNFTYVNCNGYFSYTEAELLSLNSKRDIPFCGRVADFEFQKIIKGFLISMRVDEEFKDEVRMFLRDLE